MCSLAKILLAEDHADLAATVVAGLEAERHVVDTAYDGEQAASLLKTEAYDVLVIDWDLPLKSGIALIRDFRAAGGTAPIIMLTGKSSIASKEEGMDSGADDYLTKPFDQRELNVRVRALLRRSTGTTPASNELRAGALTLDPVRYSLRRNGTDIRLAPRDFALLEFFMRNPGQVFSVETILNRVWSYDSDASPEGLRAAIRRIRRAVDVTDDPNQSIIENVARVGYRLRETK